MSGVGPISEGTCRLQHLTFGLSRVCLCPGSPHTSKPLSSTGYLSPKRLAEMLPTYPFSAIKAACKWPDWPEALPDNHSYHSQPRE